MAGPPQMPNNFLQYRDSATETRHPIRLYSRYVYRLHILFRFMLTRHEIWSSATCLQVLILLITTSSDTIIINVAGLGTVVWGWSNMMSILEALAVFWNIKQRLPRSLTTIEWEDTFASYSKDNPQLLFSMCGFEVQILPKIRTVWRTVFTERRGLESD